MERVTIAWLFGATWFAVIGAGAPINTFATKLGANNFIIGVIAATPALASLLQLLISPWIDASGNRKKIFLIALLSQRMLSLVLGILPLLFINRDDPSDPANRVALGVFLAIYVTIWLLQSGGIAWVSWMADLVPNAIRGRYFARRRQWGMLTWVPTAILSGMSIDWAMRHENPLLVVYVCAGLFFLTSIGGIIDIAIFFKVPHVKYVPKQRQSVIRFWITPFTDCAFILPSLYAGLIFMTVLPMGMFSVRFMQSELNTSATTVQLSLSAIPALALLIVLPTWGRCVDRVGRKPLMTLSTLLLVPVAFAWLFVDRETIWLGYVLAALGAMLWSAVEVANFNLILRASSSASDDEPGSGKGSGYSAANIATFSMFGVFGGWLAGLFLDVWGSRRIDTNLPGIGEVGGFEMFFVGLAVLRLLSLGLLPWVKEPDAGGTWAAARFIARDLSGTLKNFVIRPIRMLREREEPREEEQERT